MKRILLLVLTLVLLVSCSNESKPKVDNTSTEPNNFVIKEIGSAEKQRLIKENITNEMVAERVEYIQFFADRTEIAKFNGIIHVYKFEGEKYVFSYEFEIIKKDSTDILESFYSTDIPEINYHGFRPSYQEVTERFEDFDLQFIEEVK